MHHLSLLMTLALVAATGTTVSKDATPSGLPDWMSGDWCSRDGDERGEEHWLPPAGGMMLGMARTVAPGHDTQFEFLRIEIVDGMPTYVAQPRGAPPTAFKRTNGGGDWIRFENPSHDYPTRIEYRHSGDGLHAEIAGPGKEGRTLTIAYEFKRCDDHERTIRALFEAFNRHDVEAIVSLYAADAYLMSSDFNAPRHGREGVRRTYSELFAQLPQVRDEVKTLIVNGDQAAVEFVSSWPSEGGEAAGKLEIATFLKFRDRKIVSDTSYFNAEPAPPR